MHDVVRSTYLAKSSTFALEQGVCIQRLACLQMSHGSGAGPYFAKIL